MAENNKCAHPACNCRVAAGEKYCSTYCHDARNTIARARSRTPCPAVDPSTFS